MGVTPTQFIDGSRPIVDLKTGNASPDFLRQLFGQLNNMEEAIAALENTISGDSGIDGGGSLLDGPVVLSGNIQGMLNGISSTRGAVLYRGAALWAALVPGTSGYFLKTLGAGADPLWASAAADIQALLDSISSTRGSVLYRGAAGWVALPPGTSGYFLKTLGAGADPAWASSAADIQVLLDAISSTQGALLYRGASAWSALAPGTSGYLLKTQGASANPIWVDASIQTLLDGISSTQGVVLYRGASSWSALAPGTSGYFLKTNGASANPAWASAAADIQSLLDGISSTQGTILYRGSSSWTALAPGTSGQFLKTLGSGANPAWATPSVGSTTFSGALANKSTDETTADYSTIRAVAWPAETYDTDAYHDNSTNNSRLTIPSGISRVVVWGCVAASAVAASAPCFLQIRKNGSNAYIGAGLQFGVSRADGSGLQMQVATAPGISVTAGDYFELFFSTIGDSSITVASANSSFGIQALA